MPQRDSLDLQTFCTFCTTESSLSSQTLVPWGVSCYSSVEQVHLIDALWGHRCLGRMDVLGHRLGGWLRLLIWDLCKIATWPSKERQKLKQKLLHLAVQMTILPLAPEERRKISPKSPRNPEELSQHAHAKHWERGDNILCQSLIRITQQIFFDELWGQHQLDAGHHPSVSQTPWTLIQDANLRITCQSPP